MLVVGVPAFTHTNTHTHTHTHIHLHVLFSLSSSIASCAPKGVSRNGENHNDADFRHKNKSTWGSSPTDQLRLFGSLFFYSVSASCFGVRSFERQTTAATLTFLFHHIGPQIRVKTQRRQRKQKTYQTDIRRRSTKLPHKTEKTKAEICRV